MMTVPNVETISRLVAMLEGADDSLLDEAVIDAKCEEACEESNQCSEDQADNLIEDGSRSASEINNSGLESQIEYLIEVYGVDGAEEIIFGVIKDQRHDEVPMSRPLDTTGMRLDDVLTTLGWTWTKPSKLHRPGNRIVDQDGTDYGIMSTSDIWHMLRDQGKIV
jgi:hypothetical protein